MYYHYLTRVVLYAFSKETIKCNICTIPVDMDIVDKDFRLINKLKSLVNNETFEMDNNIEKKSDKKGIVYMCLTHDTDIQLAEAKAMELIYSHFKWNHFFQRKYWRAFIERISATNYYDRK